MDPALHILGIRHHGPGSAKSLIGALKFISPDCILLEGPPDAAEVLHLAASQTMKPPVAILIHAADQPQRAVYYPFAIFSPEWNTIRWAQHNNVEIRFFDLPMTHRMALDKQLEQKLSDEIEAAAKAVVEPQMPSSIVSPSPPEMLVEPELPEQRDPIGELANAAGFEDGERWWEHVVEHREEIEIFPAILEAMAVLREVETTPQPRDQLREAWMRREIRTAQKAGFKNIAVVCGAWHTPALNVQAVSRKEDDQLLKGLPKLKTTATWVPWTYDRLTFASGYGAGVRSPGWYEHVWQCRQGPTESWMTRIARMLREKGIDCSSAHIIEGVRLSHTLATLRGRPRPDISDINDAVRTVFCFDSDLPLQLIQHELFIGDRIGEVPDETPMVPLQQDLNRLQKSLRLKPQAREQSLDMDLRNQTDRNRSTLLHRLNLLGVRWGIVQHGQTGKGTFHEIWKLRWDPGMVVQLIIAGALGNTIELAAAAQLSKLAGETTELQTLVSLMDDALLSDVGQAVQILVGQIQAIAAVAHDVTLLMSALPGLARILRYGSVRQIDTQIIRHIIDGIVPRITIGLGGAMSSLNDEAARAMVGHLQTTHSAIEMLESSFHTANWYDAIARLIGQTSVHGLVRGRAARQLLDAGKLTGEDASGHMSLMMSPGTDAWQAAMWIDGFLAGSGLLLVHNPKLLGVIDYWIEAISKEQFDELVPILRRTFSVFARPERRQIGESLTRNNRNDKQPTVTLNDIDQERAMRPVALLLKILGGDTLA